MTRVATDVGGTFTDLAAYEENGEGVIVGKASTTPDISEGVADVIRKAALTPSDISHFIHGSTVAINTVIERKGVKTALLTTQGFRDALEIARGNIINAFDLLFSSPEPLVPRNLRFEIDERMRADGTILRSLDERQVASVLHDLKGEEVEAIAVCLLHAYANPEHEQAVREIIRREYRDEVFTSVSSDILREYREFERTSTTVLNAYIGPRVSAYLNKMQTGLAEGGFSGNAAIMQSNGGTMSFEMAKVQPVRTMESGPVGGAVAAARIAQRAGYENAVAFDMGGTTAKVSVVSNGEPEIAEGYWIGGEAMGYPLQLPVVDVVEIGAGGGSIAHVDEMGALKVGPRSAGAVPGPVCYGKGGSAPTVTDADLVLGRLNPDYFLGGEIALETSSSHDAIERDIARPLGMDLIRAAFGIVKIADTHMAHAVRLMTVQKGHDPREFSLVAYGGAGPGHAVAVARELGIRTVMIPAYPGILSAIGMLLTDAKEELVLSRIATLGSASGSGLERLYAELEAEGVSRMKQAGFSDEAITTRRSADMRYTGQEFTLRAPVVGTITDDYLPVLGQEFSALHELRYGHAFERAVPQIVTLRVEVLGRVAKPEIGTLFQPDAGGAANPEESRQVYFEETGFIDCGVYRRDRLGAAAVLNGPAVIEEEVSTTLVHPGDVVRLDGDGNMVIEIAETGVRGVIATHQPAWSAA